MKTKITDKQRLNFLDLNAREGTPGGWFIVNCSDGSIQRLDCGNNRDDYEGDARPTIRQAIDAAIRSRQEKNRPSKLIPPTAPKLRRGCCLKSIYNSHGIACPPCAESFKEYDRWREKWKRGSK